MNTTSNSQPAKPKAEKLRLYSNEVWGGADGHRRRIDVEINSMNLAVKSRMALFPFDLEEPMLIISRELTSAQ